MRDAKITVQNPNTSGRSEYVRPDKYNEMRAALTYVLPDAASGLSFADLKEAAKLHLCPNLFSEGKTSGWWAKCVQLDLDAKGLMTRLPTKPPSFRKNQRPASSLQKYPGGLGASPQLDMQSGG